MKRFSIWHLEASKNYEKGAWKECFPFRGKEGRSQAGICGGLEKTLFSHHPLPFLPSHNPPCHPQDQPGCQLVSAQAGRVTGGRALSLLREPSLCF